MPAFTIGDRVRIDIPAETDPDFARYHGRVGTVVAVLEDDAGTVTGDPHDSRLYRVAPKDDTPHDLRWRDLRPI